MSSQFDCLNLCRLCLMKDRVQVPIFEDAGEVNQIFLKIHACLPIKLSRDDKLPKKICDDCLCKVELFYQFWNTAVDSEKQLLQWLGMEEMEDKQQGYVTEVLDPNVMKHEGSSDNRLDGNVLQVGGHQNMDLNMINNISIITMPAANEQSFSTVPMGADGTVHIAGPSTSVVHNQAGVAHLQEVDVHHEDVDNIDDGCDNDNGLTVKGEIGEDDRSMEQTYVTLSCDEAGPSGLQQQKLSDISEIAIQQSTDGEHKTGCNTWLRRTRGRKSGIVPSSSSSTKPNVNTRPQRTKSRVVRAKTTLSCHRVALKKAIIKHEETDEEEDYDGYTCAKCGNNFESLASLREHSKAHTFSCEHCSLSFRLRKQLKKHVSEAHSSVPRFVCSECESVFKCRQSLREHLVRKHTEGFRFVCASCGKKFKMKSDLYMHVQSIHSTEREAICDVCGKTYRNAFALKKHLAHAHNQRPFACEICKRKLATKQSLEQHALLHLKKERAVCQICGNTFSGNDALKKHMRIHTGQRPFPCKICGKTFRRQNTHKQHLLTHSGVKPYVCDICGKAFTQKPGLITHRKKHPGPLPPLPSISIDYVIADLIDKTENSRNDRVYDQVC